MEMTELFITPLARLDDVGARLVAELSSRVGAWPERADTPPVVHHVETWRYRALVTHLETHPRSLVDLFPWTPRREHGRATLFLPLRFTKPFEHGGYVVGSSPLGEAVVRAWYWPGETAPAVQVLSAALSDANRLGLCLVVGHARVRSPAT